MATYNYGSVRRVNAVYQASTGAIGLNTYLTLFQAAAAPTLTYISGFFRFDGNTQKFLFLSTQNNNATGFGWQFVSSPNSALQSYSFGSQTAPFTNGAAANQNAGGPGVYGIANQLVFNNFLVPPGFFVQFQQSGGAAVPAQYSIIEVRESLT